MDFSFIIPSSRDDLLTKRDDSFVVDEVYPVRLVSSKLQEFRKKLFSQGPGVILSDFDTLFTVLCNMNNLDGDVKGKAWDIALKLVGQCIEQFPTVSDLSAADKKKQLNVVKMVVYVVTQFTETFETEATIPTADQVVAGKKGRKKKGVALVQSTGGGGGGIGWDWEEEGEKAIEKLLQLCQLPLTRLWDPPVAEDEFTSMLTSCCYKMLENPNTVKRKTCKESIFHLLGVLVKKYNHGVAASLKAIQMVQHFEHLHVPMAQAVATYATKYGAKSVVGDVMREVGSMQGRDLVMDTSGTRGIIAFLVELSQQVPDLMLPSISVLVSLLDEEPYNMRNAVLTVLGELLVRLLSGEDMDEKKKQDRDRFFDKLEDHLCDTNAFVRSKVLQIFLNIINEKALPLNRQQQLAAIVIGRLQDRSSQVRKNSMHLIICLIKSNPFAANLSVEDLQSSLEAEQGKLTAMVPAAQKPVPYTAEEEWVAMEPEVKEIVSDYLQTCESQESGEVRSAKEEEGGRLDEKDSVNSVTERICGLLREGQHRTAVRLLMAAQEEFPDSVLSLPVSQDSEELFSDGDDEDESKDHCKQRDQIVTRLMSLFKGRGSGEDEPMEVEDGTQAPPTQAGLTNEEVPVNDVTKQQVLVQYLTDCLCFVQQIQSAIPVVCQLLASKTVTDIVEAVEFFVTGFEFGVSNMMLGVQRMSALVWSREKSIRDSVVEAYRRLYITSVSGTAKAQAFGIVKNLTLLATNSHDMTSLEELVSELVKNGDINSHVILTLWQRFTRKIQDTTEAESRTAILLLSMAGSAKAEIIRSNVDVIVQEGLSQDRALSDFPLTRDICLALLKLAGTTKHRAGTYQEPFRMPTDHDMFKRLVHILTEGVFDVGQNGWIPMAEQAVNVIYKLAEKPDTICGDLIKAITSRILSNNTDESGDLSCPSLVLSRLISLAGHVALSQLVHLDVSVFGELKRRIALKENTASDNKSINQSKASDAADIEDEMGLAGAAAEDNEAEYVRRITESEIVTGSNLLALFRPLLLTVCNNHTKYTSVGLQASASLALSKFMLVSSEFCDAHLQLLFTILERSPHAVIRANTIVSLGDLTFRFPNLIEPWTPSLYARLGDDSVLVRKNALMVLTRLILNDMVKVKGQISEMAACIVDEEPAISGLAKHFFLELSKKGNSVYNVMPDMVSRLSDPEVGVSEEHFNTIMKYLFSFIQKDRQCESLVEKLCLRFKATKCERQWTDLAFCLSLLTYSEKGIQKLQELFSCYSDKLSSPRIFDLFSSIISGAKKFTKPEAKVLIDELESKMEKCHVSGVDDEQALRKARNTKAGRKTKGGPKKRPNQKRKFCSSDEDEEVDSSGDSEAGDENETPPTVRRTGRAGAAAAGDGPAGESRKGKRKPVFSFTSSEAEEEEDGDVTVKEVITEKKGRRAAKASKSANSRAPAKKPALQFSSAEEEEEDEDQLDNSWTEASRPALTDVSELGENDVENSPVLPTRSSRKTRQPPPSAKSTKAKGAAVPSKTNTRRTTRSKAV